MKYLIYVLLLMLSFSLQGQILTGSEVKDDLLQLKKAIRIYNPALDTYNPAFDLKADSLISTVPADSVSPINAFGLISQLCALSNEGHFSTGHWQDDIHSGFLANEYLYLPVSVKVLQKKIMVWSDFSGEQKLKRGDEIISINQLTAETIREKFYKAVPADGLIKTYVDRNIELGFSWMFYLYISQPDTFHLEIKDSSGEIKKVSIQALDRKTQVANYARFYPESSDDSDETETFHTLKYEGDVSFLTLPSFDYRKVEEFNIKSKRFYKDIFRELKEKQIKNLVIDLRGNTGGRNEFADDMVPYILKKEVDAPFLKKTVSWEGKTKTYKFPKPSKLAFTGNIFVLVDGRTYSAGNTLARYLNEYAGATIIGEETGTRYEGFAAGSKQEITLNNSRLKIGIPRYHIFFPESGKQFTTNRGLIPHHQTQYSVQDVILNIDRHSEMVHSLIEENKTVTHSNYRH